METHNLIKIPWESEQKDLFFRIFTISSQDYRNDDTHLYPRRVEGSAVCICLQGEGEVFIDHKSYSFRQNDMFILFPNAVYQPICHSDDFICYILGTDITGKPIDQLDYSVVLPLYFHIRENPCISLTDEDVHILVGLGDTIKEKVRRIDHPYRKEIAEHLMIVFFYEISAIYQRGRPVIQRSRKRDEELFEQFLFLVTQHCRQERQLEFYANQLFLTSKYLSSVVKQVSGQSASEWIARMVISNAKTLLRSSSLTVQQIANELNFPNPSFFGQYFKKHMGMTPKEYKQNL